MNKFYQLTLAYFLFCLSPTFGCDDLHDRAPNRVHIGHLPLTDVKICLWNNATGTLDRDAAGYYICSTLFPTVRGEKRLLSMSRADAAKLDLARFFLTPKEKGHFFGMSPKVPDQECFTERKMPLKLEGEWLDCQAYNALHGELRAQKVIAALTALYKEKIADQVTEDDLNAIYVSEWQTVSGKMYEKVLKVLREGKVDAARNNMHSREMNESSTIMQKVSMITDADALASMIAQDGFTNEAAIELARHAALKHTVGFADKKEEAPVAPAEPETKAEPKFSEKTEKMFKGMFNRPK